MHSFSLPIAVQSTDIDALGHVNNVVYLRWMQEAAEAHWETAAPAGSGSRPCAWWCGMRSTTGLPAGPAGVDAQLRAPFGWCLAGAAAPAGVI